MIYDMILQYKIIIYDIVYDIMYDKYRILPAGQVGLPFRQCTGYLARMSSCSLVICLKMKTRAIIADLPVPDDGDVDLSPFKFRHRAAAAVTADSESEAA